MFFNDILLFTLKDFFGQVKLTFGPPKSEFYSSSGQVEQKKVFCPVRGKKDLTRTCSVYMLMLNTTVLKLAVDSVNL